MSSLVYPRRVPAVVEKDSSGLRWPEILAHGLAGLFGMAVYAEITRTGPAIQALGSLVALGALSSAVLSPGRMPLFLALYVPYNHYFPISPLPGLNLTNILFIAAVIAWVRSRLTRARRIPLAPFDGLVMVYTAVAFAAMLNAARASGFGDAFHSFKVWLHPILFYMIVKGLVDDRRDVRMLLIVMLHSVFWVALDTMFEGQSLGGKDFHDSRAGGVLRQPNNMGAFLAYYGAPMVGWVLRPAGGRAGRWAALGGFVVVVRALFFTYSRGAYGSLSAAVVMMLLAGNPAMLVLVAGVATAGGTGLLPSSVSDRLTISGSTVSDESDAEIYGDSESMDPSLRRRLVLWAAARAMVADRPLGVGLGRFKSEVDEYLSEPLGPNEPRDAHNAYLLTAAEMGVQGAVLMVSLLLAVAGRAFWLARKRRDPVDRCVAIGVMGMVFAVAFSCMFGSRFSEDGVIGYFWMLCAMLTFLGRLPQSARKRPAPRLGAIS